MPELTMQFPVADADSAATWFNRNLSQVLGLQPSMTALRSDHLTLLTTDQERRALADIVNRRFLRKIDEATGEVSFEIVGAALVHASDEADDPVLREIARSYLTGAKAALGTIDTELCRPGTCQDQVEGLVWQADETIERLITEVPHRSSVFLVFLHLDQLCADDRGILSKLRKMICQPADGDPMRTVWHEKSCQALYVATRAIDCFREALCDVLQAEDEVGMSRFWEIVERCAPHVAVHAATVRAAFTEVGIGDCELERYEIDVPPVAAAMFGACEVRAINFGGFLNTLEAEPQRWTELAKYGAFDQRESLTDAAIVLLATVNLIDGDKVVKSFNLSGDQKAELIARIDRMRAYAVSVFTAIIGGPAQTGKGGAGHGGKRGGGGSGKGGGKYSAAGDDKAMS